MKYLAVIVFQIFLPIISNTPQLPPPSHMPVTMHITYMNAPISIETEATHTTVSVLGIQIIENQFIAFPGPCSDVGNGHYYVVQGGLYTMCSIRVEIVGDTLTGIIGNVRIPLN